MITIDEQALICDLAEVYGIFNYKEYPVRLIGTLAWGLRDNSRIKLKICNQKVSNDTLLLAHIADRVGVLSTMYSEKKFPSFVDIFCQFEEDEEKTVTGYQTSEDFENAMNKIRRM